MGKLLIDFDIDVVHDMVRQAFALNPNFSKRPNYLLQPGDDGIWYIVGLADSEGGAHYYPQTSCPNCGQIKALNPQTNPDKQLYEIYCVKCSAFCNDVAIYTPLPKAIDAIVREAFKG